MGVQEEEMGIPSDQKLLLRRSHFGWGEKVDVLSAAYVSSRRNSCEMIDIKDSDQSTSTTIGEAVRWRFHMGIFLKNYF